MTEEYQLIKDWFHPGSPENTRTLLLVGGPGVGKSATGNTIIGEHKFITSAGYDGCTTTCSVNFKEFRTGLYNGTKTAYVIDTPGLPNSKIVKENLGKEFSKCLHMVKGGISALVVVLSITSDFDELCAVDRLEGLYGPNVYDYMVVVFTGGDKLENNKSLDALLTERSSMRMMKFLERCKYRKVLFDNKSKLSVRSRGQLDALFAFVEDVVNTTARMPFYDQVQAYLKAHRYSSVEEAAYDVFKEIADEPPSLEIKELTVIDREEIELEEARSPSEINSAILKEQVEPANVVFAAIDTSEKLLSGGELEAVKAVEDEKLLSGGELEAVKAVEDEKLLFGGELKAVKAVEDCKKKRVVSTIKRKDAPKKGIADMLSESFYE